MRSNRLFKGSAPAGAHKMHERTRVNLVAPILISSPSNPHSIISRIPITNTTHASSLANGRQQKNDRAPRQGAVSRIGSGSAGEHKMGAANLVPSALNWLSVCQSDD